MKYLLMICASEEEEAAMSDQDMGQILQEYMAFSAELEASGHYVTSDRLQPTTAATTVRVRDGELLTTDGPFAETKEQMGGYYLIDVPDLDQAIAWARKIPTVKTGSIEIRPIWEMGDM